MDKEDMSRPEKLDAHYDMLDMTGADDPRVRLPLIEGVTYCKPRTIAQIMREDFGPEGDGMLATLAPIIGGPASHSPS